MRRFVCCLLLPAVSIVGLVAIGAKEAEARRWIRRVPARVVVVNPPVVVTRPAPVVVSPPAGVVVGPPAPVIVHPRPYYYRYYSPYWRPRVDVYAPGVEVQVGPRGTGGSVVAPGVGVWW